MPKFYLKDWYGKEQEFTDDKIFVRGEDGELIQFTQGTGGSADVRYVTFMSYDGTVEYGKKAVAVGDDCADPIARGVFDTPTRESTAQYNYTFYGWATTPNGAADSNWNKSITEDKTVYANFAAAVRYYTITYYDSDGTTVLKTESLAYGSTPSYAPTKENYVFGGWEPSVTTVIGNASYTAMWEEKIAFATASWAKIAEISAAGKAKDYFAVGDTKTISVKWRNSTVTSINVELEIIGFDHDDLADGSGKAGITIGTKNALHNYYLCGIATVTMTNGWANSDIRTALNGTVLANLPTDMTTHIKSVTKLSKAAYNDITTVTTTDKLFVPSSTEFANRDTFGTQYEHYKSTNNRKKYTIGKTSVGSSYEKHFTRTPLGTLSYGLGFISDTGTYTFDSSHNEASCVCFCI